MPVIIHGRAPIHPDHLAAVQAAAVALAAASRAEPGCLEYRFSADLADPALLILTEEWASEEALQAHFATPGFASFSEVLLPALAAPPDFLRFDAEDARPLFG